MGGWWDGADAEPAACLNVWDKKDKHENDQAEKDKDPQWINENGEVVKLRVAAEVERKKCSQGTKKKVDEPAIASNTVLEDTLAELEKERDEVMKQIFETEVEEVWGAASFDKAEDNAQDALDDVCYACGATKTVTTIVTTETVMVERVSTIVTTQFNQSTA
jgi:hypothetical protein